MLPKRGMKYRGGGVWEGGLPSSSTKGRESYRRWREERNGRAWRGKKFWAGEWQSVSKPQGEIDDAPDVNLTFMVGVLYRADENNKLIMPGFCPQPRIHVILISLIYTPQPSSYTVRLLQHQTAYYNGS